MYFLGAAAVARNGMTINWAAYFLGQAAVTFIQLMAQYLNEYYDIEVDNLGAENRTWFSGGSGILSSGGVSPSAVLAAAQICAAAGVLTGILASIFSPWMIPILILSLLGSWFYSAPPISLMSSGWGELTTSVIVALLVPLAGYCMQAGFPTGELWLVCAPLILIHIAMLVSFEFPDRNADLAFGKKTLAVRLGLRGAAWLIDALIGSAFVILAVYLLFLKNSLQWIGLALPLAVWQMVAIHRIIPSPTRIHYYVLTTGGVILFILMSVLVFQTFFGY